MINVVWHDGQRGAWDHGIFLQTFEKYPDLFPQYNEKINPSFERAIVMCVGKPDVRMLKQYLSGIKSGVVIFASEEDAFFPWKEVMHEGLEAFTQYYHPSTKSEIPQENRILLGAPYRIKDFKINKHLPKKYLWSFIGQVQNPFRQQCVEVLRTLPDGYLREISGFGGYVPDGIDYQSYLDVMCQSKIVICPAGSQSVDSFRLYESMICGAVPITDVRSPRDREDFDYWNEVYMPSSIIKIWDWKELDIQMMDYYSGHEQTINRWWVKYQKELEQKLLNLAQ